MANIVRLVGEHIPEVAEIEGLSFSDPWSEDALKLLIQPNCVAFVALVDGRVAAYGGMMFVLDEGNVINIATHPDYRRRGLAKAILSELYASARELSLSVMFLEVREKNLAARELYRLDGWEPIGIRANFYSHPLDNAVVMKKEVLI